MKRSNEKTKDRRSRAALRAELKDLMRLYEADETGWLERMAELIQAGRFDQLDYKNLCEYLRDMARRDRREVLHRLTTLLAHLLKWDHQPAMRSRSWENTLAIQRHELQDLFESQTLRNYAQEVLQKAYSRARDQAAAETGLPESRFPEECPYPLENLFAEE
jgi:hypothetical protein